MLWKEGRGARRRGGETEGEKRVSEKIKEKCEEAEGKERTGEYT